MAKDTATVAARNRRIRREALRDELSAKGLLAHVIDIATKLTNETVELDSTMVQRLKAAADINIKLINKYLPDEKEATDLNLNGTLNTTFESREELEQALRAKGIDPEWIASRTLN